MIDCYGPITRLLKDAPQGLNKSLDVRSYLLTAYFTIEQVTRRVLMYLSASCRWGMKHKLIANNPFDGMHRELPEPRYMVEELANSFTAEERDRIIETFESHS